VAAYALYFSSENVVAIWFCMIICLKDWALMLSLLLSLKTCAGFLLLETSFIFKFWLFPLLFFF